MATVARKPVHRGEHEVSRKPLRREGRIASAEPVCSCACSYAHLARETAGAARIRLSLRPRLGGRFLTTRALRAARMRTYVGSPSLRAKRSNPFALRKGRMDCFRLRSSSYGGQVVALLLAMTALNPLNRLPRIGHRRGEAAIDRDRLTVDVGRLVAGEEQSHRRQFMRLAGALQGIELADPAVGAALPGVVEDRFCHSGFDPARTHRID